VFVYCDHLSLGWQDVTFEALIKSMKAIQQTKSDGLLFGMFDELSLLMAALERNKVGDSSKDMAIFLSL